MTPLPPSGLQQKICYWIAVNGVYTLYRAVWRLKVYGLENVPKTGGVILASNHLSLADPPLIGCTSPRKTFFFAKEELFSVPFVGWAITQLNSFPVKRFSHDVGAFRTAKHVLENGNALALFPEGRRSRTGELGQAKPGVAMLAVMADVPVVPVCVVNTNHLKKFRQMKIAYGPPLHAPKTDNPKEIYQSFSDEIIRAIANMMSKMYNDAND